MGAYQIKATSVRKNFESNAHQAGIQRLSPKMNETSSDSTKLPSGNLAFDEFYERLDQNDSSANEANQLKKTGKWTAEEDELLNKYVPMYGEKQWRKIAAHIPGRSSIQCLHRWSKILKPGLVKGPWTQEEDRKLIAWVQAEGPTKWAQAACFIKGRSGKQCRERWFNNLCPGVKKGSWSEEEDEMIFQLYQKYGSSWSKIAKYIPGRTENAIKNRFYATLRKLAADKKRTCLENSTNDIKRELSDSFSNENDESTTVTPKPGNNTDDQKKSAMTLETPQADSTENSPDKTKMSEKQERESDKMDLKSKEKGSTESSSKAEQRNEVPNYLFVDNSQNMLYKLLNQEISPGDLPAKEKKEEQSESREIRSDLKLSEQASKNSCKDFAAKEKRFESNQDDSDRSNYQKETGREALGRKLYVKRTPSFQNTVAKLEEEDDDEEFNTIEKMKRKFNSMANANGNDSYQISSNLDFMSENPRGSNAFSLSKQQDFSERNTKTRNSFDESAISRFELNGRATPSSGRSQNFSAQALNELLSPKMFGDGFRHQSGEKVLSMSNRRDLLMDDFESESRNRRIKEEPWPNSDSRSSAFSKRDPLGHPKQIKTTLHDELGSPFRKVQRTSRTNLEALDFELPQSRNGSLSRSHSQNQSPYIQSQFPRYTARDSSQDMDEEEEDTADAIQMSLADELLNGLKQNSNSSMKPRSEGLLRSFSVPAARDLIRPSDANTNLGPRRPMGGPGFQSEEKISSLFEQLHSLESLLSTTRSELTKMETNHKQDDHLMENLMSRRHLDYNPSGLRMPDLHREDDIFKGNFLIKRRY